MSISLIVAVGKNREIGKNNGLCFRIPGDLKFFKKVTMGHPIFMGRKTWESLPKKLPGREHYIISSKKDGLPEDVHYVSDVKAFVAEWADSEEELFVIGGASVYTLMLPYCEKLYITEVDGEDKDADAFFPKFNKRNYSRKTLAKGEDNGLTYKHVLYTVKPLKPEK